MLKELGFDGAAVVVTGAANGIGRASCTALAELGARVIGVDIEADFEDKVQSEGHVYGAGAVGIVADVSIEEEVRALRARVEGEVDSLAAVVNVVGVGSRRAVVEMPLAEWQRVLQVSLTSTFLTTRELLPLVEAARGSFVNVASTHAFVGLPFGSAYSASKAGVVGFTRQLATEVGALGVRANSVCPGPVNTKGRDTGHGPESTMSTVLRRSADASEIANVIAFLASPASSFVTGAAVMVDGGQSVHRGIVDTSRVQ